MNMRFLLFDFLTLRRTLNLSLWLVLAALSGCAQPLKSPIPSMQSPRLALAFAYYQNGQYRVALDESRKVRDAQPDEPHALALQGLIYVKLHEPELAQQSFLRAEQGAPQDADIAHNYGLFLCEQGQYKSAFERFGRAVQQPLYADKSKTWWVWGVCAQKSGDETAAQSLWVQSLVLSPSAQPALALARSYQQQQMLQQASEVLNRINGTTESTPETLWLGIQLARKQADTQSIKHYALQLQKRFPTSSQWGAFEREAYDE